MCLSSSHTTGDASSTSTLLTIRPPSGLRSRLVEAFPEDNVPHYLVRDRDGIYGEHFRSRVEGIGIEQIPIAPKSPWQNCYVERVIGSIRRECLNHIIVVNDQAPATHSSRIFPILSSLPNTLVVGEGLT